MEKRLDITIGGDSKPFGAAAKEAMGHFNKLSEAERKRQATAATLAKWRQELAKYARSERDQAQSKLTVDQQINRLLERRAAIQERLARAGVSETRRTALQLQERRINERVSGLSSGASGAVGGVAAAGLMGGFRGLLARLSPWALAASAGAAAISKNNDAVRYAGELADMADKVGVGVESLQAFGIAAAQSGTSMDTLIVALREMEVSQAKALTGSKADAEAFERLGISIEQLKTLKPEQLFLEMARHIETSPHSAQLMADAMATLGRSAADVLPALKSGFAEAAEQARRLGAVISEDTIAKLDAVGDRWEVITSWMRAKAASVRGTVDDAMAGLGAEEWRVMRWFRHMAAGWYTTGKISAFGPAAIASAWRKSTADAEARLVATAPQVRQPNVVPPNAEAAPGSTEPPLNALGATSHTSMPAADALARIGLFRGGAGDGIKRTMDQQLATQRKMEMRLQAIEAHLTPG